MKSSKELQLKSYQLIVELFEQGNWDTSVIHYVLKNISDWLEMDYLALYGHFQESVSLRLLAAYSKHGEDNPVRFIRSEDVGPSDFFKGQIEGDIHFLPIQLKDADAMLLVYRRLPSLSREMLVTLKKELEKMFSIIEQFIRKTQQNKNNLFLLDTSTRLLKANDKQDVLYEIVQALKQMYSEDEYTYHLILTQEYEETRGLPIKPMQYDEDDFLSVRTEVFMTGELQIEISEDQSRKIIYAPLTGEQSVYGILEINAPIESYIQKLEVEFIEDFAMLSGKALEKTILYENSLHQVNKLTLLNEIVHKLNAERELKDLTKLIQYEIMKISQATEVGFIYFDEESEHKLEILVGSTLFFKTEEGKRLVNNYKEKMMHANEAIFIGNAQGSSAAGFQSVMVIPMVYSGLSLGFTLILHEESYHFRFEDFKLIESLMQHSALAISNTLLREKLQETVITDFLTQLYTRKYVEDKLNEHLQAGMKGSLLLFDIDDFKKVNDTYGHHVGDRVLKQVALIIEEAIKNKGIAGRWGGEEFVVYVPEVSSEEGWKLADAIREAISIGTEPTISVSCGISYWEKHTRSPMETQNSLFLRADQALYQAKTGGKNRIEAL